MPFLSHSLAPTDEALAARLRALAAVNGITLELPFRMFPGVMSAETAQRIDRADVVLGILTADAYTADVVAEVNRALGQKKPVVLLVENTIALPNLGPKVRIVWFDRSTPWGHEAQVIDAVRAAITDTKAEPQRAVSTGIFGTALALLGLGIAAAIASDEPPKRPRRKRKR